VGTDSYLGDKSFSNSPEILLFSQTHDQRSHRARNWHGASASGEPKQSKKDSSGKAELS